MNDVGVVAEEGAGGVEYWMSGRHLVIRLCCIVLAVSAVCVIAYLYSLLPLYIYAQVLYLCPFLFVLGAPYKLEQWAGSVGAASVVCVSVIGVGAEGWAIAGAGTVWVEAVGVGTVGVDSVGGGAVGAGTLGTVHRF